MGLSALIPRLRIYTNDNPSDPYKQLKTDAQWHSYLEEAVRMFMYGKYSIVNGEITPAPNEADSLLIILWAAYLYYYFGIDAIARESTALFSISYDAAYAQIRDRISQLLEEIMKLDPTSAMRFLSETDFEAWGKVGERLSEAVDRL